MSKLYVYFMLASSALASYGQQGAPVEQGAPLQAAPVEHGAPLQTAPIDQGAPVQQGGHEYSHYYQQPEPIFPEPICCVSLCPLEAPYFDLESCSCVRGHIVHSVPVSDYDEEYGHQEEAPQAFHQDYHYRRLQYGQAGRATGAAQQAFPQQQPFPQQQVFPQQHEAFQGVRQDSHGHDYDMIHDEVQPEGTIDTRYNRLYRGGRIACWVAFALLLLAAWVFIHYFLYYYCYAEDCCEGQYDWRCGAQHGDGCYMFLAQPALIIGLVCFFSALAYLAIATYHGGWIRCYDGRIIWWCRYVDWVITTPLLLYILAYFANADDNLWLMLFFFDIIVMVAGLIGAVCATYTDKWIFFGFAFAHFIPILYFLCSLDKRKVDCCVYDGYGRKQDCLEGGACQPYIWFLLTYRKLLFLTVFAWILYPVIWILAEGTGRISVDGEVIAYAVLDIFTKVVFGFIVIFSKRNSCDDLRKCGKECDGHPDLDHWVNCHLEKCHDRKQKKGVLGVLFEILCLRCCGFCCNY